MFLAMGRGQFTAAIVATMGVLIATVAVAAPSIGSIDGAADVSVSAVRGQAVDFRPPSTPARYRVTIVQEWGPATHPTTLPSGWHSSPAVLAAHPSAGGMFAPGTVASPGIERMAETGSTSTLLGELAADITVGDVATGRGISGSSTDVIEINLDPSDGYLSLVTMLAPSPDWFVGFPALQMYTPYAWLDRVELDLQSYDAGTDSGSQFRSGNVDTQPRQLVSGPRDSGFSSAAAEGRFGYVVIERLS